MEKNIFINLNKENQQNIADFESENNDDNKSNDVNFEFKEGGWGWIVVIACSVYFGFFIGMVNSYTLISNKMIEKYNQTEPHAVSLSTWIGSTSNGVQSLFCSMSSVFVHLFNARIVGVVGGLVSFIGLITSVYVTNMKLYFLTFGVILGIGQALSVSAFLSILPHYFKKRIGLANGLMTFGGAIITITLPFLVELFLIDFGLANTFYLLSAMALITAVCGLTFIHKLPEDPEFQTKSNFKKIEESLQLQVLKMKGFIIWVVAGFIGFFGYLIPTYTMAHFTIINFPTHNPALISSMFGAMSGLTGIIFGNLSDILKVSPVYFHVLSYLIGGVIQMLLPFTNNFALLCISIGFLGVVDGLFMSFIVPIACEVTKSHKFANQAVGFFFSFTALPAYI